MATLQPAPALPSLLFVLLLAQACTATASTLEDTCKRYAADPDLAVHNAYHYCVKTLGADPASATADAAGLTTLAINIALSAARATAARIARLQVAETVPARRDCLDKCAEMYDRTVRGLSNAARDNVRDAGEWWEAQTNLAAAQNRAQRCDTVFVEAGQRSPLSAADRQLDEEIKLALGILPGEPPATN